MGDPLGVLPPELTSSLGALGIGPAAAALPLPSRTLSDLAPPPASAPPTLAPLGAVAMNGALAGLPLPGGLSHHGSGSFYDAPAVGTAVASPQPFNPPSAAAFAPAAAAGALPSTLAAPAAGSARPRGVALLAGEGVLHYDPLVLDLGATGGGYDDDDDELYDESAHERRGATALASYRGGAAGGRVPRECALFVTNHRVLVEPLRAPAGGAPLCACVSAIARIRTAHAERAHVAVGASGRALEIRLDVHVRNNARPAMRLQAAEGLAERLHELLRPLRAPCPLERSFACAHATAHAAAESAAGGVADSGWGVYDYAAEFARQGLLNPLSAWRVADGNRAYALCASYPPALIVPRASTDADVRASALFRSSGRFPVLCWKDAQSFASISRAGQPLVGLNGKRCREDEALLAALLETNPECETLAIVDCRPRLNAEANMLSGKGYENAHNYPRTQLQFVDIQNIHVMRDSLKRLLSALEAREEGCGEWLRELGASGWLEHVQAVLRGSRVVVQQIAQHRSVLVHCSDGWDRTSQLTALAQLQLDPFYRSLRGFAVLVEKEWLSFGHQFALRHGSHVHESGTPALLPPDEQQSPVFVQFVDAVWQLTLLCPRAFEFSQLFLASLLSDAFSNRFGTFLLDTHCARARSGLALRTRSIWSDLLERPRERGFVNPHYRPSAGILHVDLSGSSLAVFRAYYCRGPWAVDPRDARAMAEAALARR